MRHTAISILLIFAFQLTYSQGKTRFKPNAEVELSIVFEPIDRRPGISYSDPDMIGRLLFTIKNNTDSFVSFYDPESRAGELLVKVEVVGNDFSGLIEWEQDWYGECTERANWLLKSRTLVPRDSFLFAIPLKSCKDKKCTCFSSEGHPSFQISQLAGSRLRARFGVSSKIKRSELQEMRCLSEVNRCTSAVIYKGKEIMLSSAAFEKTFLQTELVSNFVYIPLK
jgi:hypothetical protein